MSSNVTQVYDVTPFLDDHPGGDEVLILATGKDATEDFEDVGHSLDARDTMKGYYIGEIDINSMPLESKNKPPSGSSTANQASGSSSTNILTIVLPILILALAYALYYFAKGEVAVTQG